MPLSRAAVWIDHQRAQVVHLDAVPIEIRQVRAHTHHTRQHGSTVRTEHEFFGEVCDSLGGLGEVLVTGGHTAQSDLKHYAEKHRPAVAQRIVGYQTVDQPTEHQLVALARAYFLARDRSPGASPASGSLP